MSHTARHADAPPQRQQCSRCFRATQHVQCYIWLYVTMYASQDDPGLDGGDGGDTSSEQASQGGSHTAFRLAEKRYQLHKEQTFKMRGGKRVSKGFIVRPNDLSDVLDLSRDLPLPEGVAAWTVPSAFPPTAAAFTFAAHPGLLLVRGALDPALQRQLVVDSLTRFCEPPNHTNHTKAFPGGLTGVWAAAQQGLRLQLAAVADPGVQEPVAQAPVAAGNIAGGSAAQAGPPPSQPTAAAAAGGQEARGDCHCPGSPAHPHEDGSMPGAPASGASNGGGTAVWGPGGQGPLAHSLLHKLRWATLGPPYDWTLRRYLRDVPHLPLPPELCQLATSLASLAAELVGGGCAAKEAEAAAGAAAQGVEVEGQRVPAGGEDTFCPDAALVNFYYEGDTLNGHVDDAEPSLERPLVSLSLGCDAIFLIGGPTKAVAPTALRLRSGDAVVLSGKARRCYHGLPRVLTAAQEGAQTPPAGQGGGTGGSGCGSEAELDGAGAQGSAFAPFARHMQHCRINISIRDTR